MPKDIELIDLLRHSRHEWLNAIQLIKGNLALDHADRAIEIIDSIIIKSQNEAKLSNLLVPQTAGYLLTFNWYSHPFKVDIEVIGENVNLKEYDQDLYRLSNYMFQLFEKHASYRTENHVLYSIQLLPNDTLITLDYSGEINIMEKFQQAVNELHFQAISLIEKELYEKEVYLCFKIN